MPGGWGPVGVQCTPEQNARGPHEGLGDLTCPHSLISVQLSPVFTGDCFQGHLHPRMLKSFI